MTTCSDPAAKRVRNDEAPGEPHGSARRRVLVVDGNEDAASSLAMLLKLLGIKTANDELTALAMIEKYHPDVIVLDIGMPETDGIEVAR